MKNLLLTLSVILSGTALAQDSTFSLKMKLTGHTRSVEVVQYSPDGKWLASGSWDGELRIYKADTPGIGNLHQSIKGHMTAVTCIAFSKDGKWIATGSKDNSVRVYETETGTLKFSSTEHSSPVSDIAFDAKGIYLLSSSGDGKINLYDLQDPSKKTKSVNYGSPINSFVMAPSGKNIFVASAKGDIDMIDFKGSVIRNYSGHTARVNCIRLSPDNKSLISGSDDKTAIIWDLAGGIISKKLTGHTWKVTSVCFSSDGRYAVSTCNDGNTLVWDAESGAQLGTLNAMGTNARSCSMSPDLTKIAVATSMETNNHGALVYNTPLKKVVPVKPTAGKAPGRAGGSGSTGRPGSGTMKK